MKDIDSLPAIEYVPSQIVAEYFRFLFKDKDGEKIDGIKYWSAKNKDEKGICYVVFADHEETVSNYNKKQILKMDVKSLKSIEIKSSEIKVNRLFLVLINTLRNMLNFAVNKQK